MLRGTLIEKIAPVHRYVVLVRASSTDVSVLPALHVGHPGCGVEITTGIDHKLRDEYDQTVLHVRFNATIWDTPAIEGTLNRLMSDDKIIWWTPANRRD